MANGYARINWEDNVTPLSAENLNKMETAIEDLYSKMPNFEAVQNSLISWESAITAKLDIIDQLSGDVDNINLALLSTSFDSETGTLKIKLKTT